MGMGIDPPEISPEGPGSCLAAVPANGTETPPDTRNSIHGSLARAWTGSSKESSTKEARRVRMAGAQCKRNASSPGRD